MLSSVLDATVDASLVPRLPQLDISPEQESEFRAMAHALLARLAVRSLLIFLAQFAALSWPSLTLGDHMNPLGLLRTCHGSLSEVPPSGPNL